MLTYIAAQGNPRGVLIPLVALFTTAVALGLWFLQKWARNLTLLSTGMTVVLWLRGFAFNAALGKATFQSGLQRQTVWVVILMDALVFAYLWGVPEAFGEQ